jgi:hypothetical protein
MSDGTPALKRLSGRQASTSTGVEARDYGAMLIAEIVLEAAVKLYWTTSSIHFNQTEQAYE